VRFLQITQHPSHITHHTTPKNGEMLGEMSGEMFREHLTIQNPHKQRVSGHSGEVLAFFAHKNTQKRRIVWK